MMGASLIAGAAGTLGLCLAAHGFCRLATHIDAPRLCLPCVAIGSSEVAAGGVIWIGLLAVIGGYL